MQYMMLLPACGFSIIKMVRQEKDIFDKIILFVFGIATVFLLVSLVSDVVYGIWDYFVVTVGSIIIFVYTLLYGAEISPAYNWRKSIFPIMFFMFFNTILALIFMDKSYYSQYFSILIFIIPNVIMMCLLFIGEEYGWRGYLQSRLQYVLGKRKGVIALGMLWEIWHIPVYISEYVGNWDELQLLIAWRMIDTVGIAIFLGWAYLRTKNIWTCVWIHAINNAIIPNMTEKKMYIYIVIRTMIFIGFLLTSEYGESNCYELSKEKMI